MFCDLTCGYILENGPCACEKTDFFVVVEFLMSISDMIHIIGGVEAEGVKIWDSEGCSKSAYKYESLLECRKYFMPI